MQKYADLVISALQAHPPIYSTLRGYFSFGKTSGQTTKGTGCDILQQLVYYQVKSWCIYQLNQVDYGKGGGTINYKNYTML